MEHLGDIIMMNSAILVLVSFFDEWGKVQLSEANRSFDYSLAPIHNRLD